MDQPTRSAERRSTFKKGVDKEDARRKRGDNIVQIRKGKRGDEIAKRRRQRSHGPGVPGGAGGGLASHRDAGVEMKLRELPAKMNAVRSENPKTQLEAVTWFRKLLSIERDPPIQHVIDSGVVPALVQFLANHTDSMLQFEAAWALTNIASGTSKHTREVIKLGAIPSLIGLLRSPNADVREQAVWGLGNIAGDSPSCRDMVLQKGALQPLLELCVPSAKVSMLRNATWTLSNFCRGKPQPPFELVAPALPVLAQLIFSHDEEVLTDACWALSYLSDDTGPNNQKIQAVIQSGVCRRLVELLMHKNNSVKTPALRTVGNIVTGDDLQTQVIINCAALPCLLALLNNPKRGIRKEACWAISNITAGNPEQIQIVIDGNIVQPLVSILRNAEFEIKKEAAWAISNATSGGSDDQIRFLVTQGCIQPLCDLFTCSDPKVIMVALEGMDNILRVGKKEAPRYGMVNKFAEFVEECGGLDNLESLQRHENPKIYEKALNVLRAYFDSEEQTEDVGLAPGVGNGSFQFQGGAPPPSSGFNFS